MNLEPVYVDRINRFSFDVDEESGRTFVSIPVRSQMVTYEENYEVDRATFDHYVADPSLALDFVAQARSRQLDHLLLRRPGTDRGVPE